MFSKSTGRAQVLAAIAAGMMVAATAWANVGHGSSVSTWSSVTEVSLFAVP